MQRNSESSRCNPRSSSSRCWTRRACDGEGSAGQRTHSLDWWLDRFAIKASQRHNAAADAFFTAQLLAILLGAASATGSMQARALVSLAGDYAWLTKAQGY